MGSFKILLFANEIITATCIWNPGLLLTKICAISINYISRIWMSNPMNKCEHFYLNYILLFMLLQLSQTYPLCPIPPWSPPMSSCNPYTVVHVSGPCICSLATLFPMLYFDPHNYSVTTNFCFLIHTTFSPIPLTPLPFDNHQNVLCIYDSDFVLLVHLFCFRFSCW